jgi:hypothetical protein
MPRWPGSICHLEKRALILFAAASSLGNASRNPNQEDKYDNGRSGKKLVELCNRGAYEEAINTFMAKTL